MNILFLIVIAIFAGVCCPAVHVSKDAGKDIPGCLTGSFPCLSLEYALQGAQMNSSIHITLSKGTYILPYNESLTQFVNKTAFVIEGQGKVTSVITCSDNAGFTFINNTDISITNVTIYGCGALHNSTSINGTNNDTMEYLTFKAGMYFLFCYNVSMDNVVVTNSSGTGVVFYSTYGRNIITSSAFTHNGPPTADMPGGGGVSVEFIYCRPGDIECNATHESRIPVLDQTATYSFKYCNFSYNHGYTSNFTDDSFIVPKANTNVALGRGGGLKLLFKGSATNNVILVDNCTLNNNTALWGGAMLIEFQDTATNNTVDITETDITSNYCHFNACNYQGTGGGGVRIQFAGFEDTVKSNKVHFLMTRFTDNLAYFGGGISFFTLPTNEQDGMNSLSFEMCTWKNNTARLGSAIDLTSWDYNGTNGGSIIVKPMFLNCIFDSNSIEYSRDYGIPVGVGTVYANSVPLQFNGTTTFTKNFGSGLASLDSSIELGAKSTTNFVGNRARNGAGILFFSKAYLKLNHHSNISFLNNVASLHGGAIYWEGIGDHQLISSRNCFIRYQDNELQNTVFKFSNNVAGLSGKAIYATTLLGCLWGTKGYGHLIDPKDKYKSVFCLNSSMVVWDYADDSCDEAISTSPGYYAINSTSGKSQCTSPFDVDVVPGEPFSMDIQTLDDRLNNISLDSVVFSMSINSHHQNLTRYTTHENTSYRGDEQEEAKLYLQTTKPRVIGTKVDLNFINCPPGFVLVDDYGKCTIGKYTYIKSLSYFKASIQHGYWIGLPNNSFVNPKEYLVGQCFFCSIKSDINKSFIPLPSNVNNLEDFFCSNANRQGTLCTECRNGYGIAINSDSYKCVNCPPEHQRYSWLLYILYEYVPLTLMLTFVVIFNISATSGPANGFIFFAQIISSTFGVDANGLINYKSISSLADPLKIVYTSLYSIWNLNFFTSIDADGWLFCLGSNITALHALTLRFIAAVYPLLVLAIIAIFVYLYDNNFRLVVFIFRPIRLCSARCFRKLNLQQSVIDSFSTFIILSYVKFVVISSYLLFPNSLEDSTGSVVYYLSLYDSNTEYFSINYAPYLIASFVIIAFCFVFPLILLIYSIKPWYSCLEKYNCARLQPGQKIQHFLNSFTNCFKDGLDGGHDCRYFAALYFYLKLALIATYALGLDWMKQYILQQVVCTFGLFILGIIQPYKKMFYNVLDMGILLLLSLINVLTIYNRYLLAIDHSLSTTSFYFQLIFIFLPLVYFVCYISVLVVRVILKNCKSKKKQAIVNNPGEIDEFSYSGFMSDVETEGRFERNNYYGTINPEGTAQIPPVIEGSQKEETVSDTSRRSVFTEPASFKYRKMPPVVSFT
jgi:predicted outer membrane repeat protein